MHLSYIYAVLAQSVARRLGKAEVGGSSPLDSFELFPGIARECGVSGVFLISADSRCRSSNLHRFQQRSRCGFSYRFTGLKEKMQFLVENSFACHKICYTELD